MYLFSFEYSFLEINITGSDRSGAVKSNIGHLEGASGIAGLIKTIMVLETGIIPPNANFEKINPEIDAEFLKIDVSKQAFFWSNCLLIRQ